MKRTAIRRQRKEGPSVSQPSGEWKAVPRDAERPRLRDREPAANTIRSLRMGTYASTSVTPVAQPKGIKARPGKRAPTVAERAWMDAIVRYGCIACWIDGSGLRPAAVHHIVEGNRRLGHLFTLPLCDPGHHQNGAQFGMISRHPWKARFEKQYGAEMDLLRELQDAIKETSCE